MASGWSCDNSRDVFGRKRKTKGALNIRHKDDKSPVTDGDIEAEEQITVALRQWAPTVPVLGEETIAQDGIATAIPKCFWLVDAVDGTRSYMQGGDEFTVNIGLIVDGEPVLGVVCAPCLDGGRCFMGAKGLGAFMCSLQAESFDEARAVPREHHSDTVLISRLHEKDDALGNFLKSLPMDSLRRIGSSVKFCLLACGEANYYPRFSPTREWDTAAGDAVLRSAGGTVLVHDNHALRYGKPDLRNPAFLAVVRKDAPLTEPLRHMLRFS